MNPIGKLDRKKMVLLVAVIFGVSGAIGANYYLNRTINEIKRQESVTASVVVAKSELPAGSMITSDTVSVREIPLEWAQSGAVKPENFESIENATLKEPMGKGEMVMWSDIKVKPTTIYMYTQTVRGPIIVGSFLTGISQEQ